MFPIPNLVRNSEVASAAPLQKLATKGPTTQTAPVNTPAFLQARGNAVCISIKLQPRASANEIGESMGPELKVRVTAPPVDAAANEMLVRYLAQVLGCPRSSVSLVRGQISRHKQVLVQGVTIEQVAGKLGHSAA
jgi:uncharacterized protein (TIGR00251 family)